MRTTHRNSGFTLIELLIVLAILVLLSSLVIMKLENVQAKSRSSTQAYSLADLSHQIQIRQGLKGQYPCGWDSLMKKPATPMTALVATDLFTKLGPEFQAPNTILEAAATTLTADQITSIKSSGINMGMLHDEASGVVPSDSGVEMHCFTTMPSMMGASGLQFVRVIDKSPGSQGLSILVRDFGLNPMMTDDPLVVPPRIAANIYVVLGLGNKCTLVGDQIDEAPYFDRTDARKYYCRALGVFEVPVTGTTRAKLVGFIGPDGRTKKMSADDYRKDSGM
ncbi:MAG: prepilin-type N-terminal cleavage/methylation domain-containing protein [Candidatus Brocadiae bacterium]|nr:prepilin-type N-terminal cleavage/methylation domain-containing protein [Candidatus Brocadiia bacterium]